MKLNDRYRFSIIEDSIGGGSFGDCFKAKDLHTGKLVCVKVIKLEQQTDLDKVLYEANMLETLRHPYIARGIEHFFAQVGKLRRLVIVMEYYEKSDVQTFVNSHDGGIRGLPAVLRLKWMRQLASAVAFLHDQQVIHRDLKLSNAFIDSQLNLHLGDFGIAKRIMQDKASTFIGTVETMAPEVIKGEPYGTQADMWSLGCVFYELISGQKPFKQQQQYQMQQSIISGQIPQLENPDGFPQALIEMTSRMLTRDIKQRATDEELDALFRKLFKQNENQNDESLSLLKSNIHSHLDVSIRNLIEKYAIQSPEEINTLNKLILDFQAVIQGESIYQRFKIPQDQQTDLDFCGSPAAALAKEDKLMEIILQQEKLKVTPGDLRQAALQMLYCQNISNK